MALTFGLGSWSCGGMVLNKLTVNQSAQVAEARDETGKVTARKAYSTSVDVSADGPLEGSAPDVGTVAIIGDYSVLVESVNVTGSNSDYQQVSISGKTIDGVAGDAIS